MQPVEQPRERTHGCYCDGDRIGVDQAEWLFVETRQPGHQELSGLGLPAGIEYKGPGPIVFVTHGDDAGGLRQADRRERGW
jgi:hypothetical protein